MVQTYCLVLQSNHDRYDVKADWLIRCRLSVQIILGYASYPILFALADAFLRPAELMAAQRAHFHEYGLPVFSDD